MHNLYITTDNNHNGLRRNVCDWLAEAQSLKFTRTIVLLREHPRESKIFMGCILYIYMYLLNV